jgi:hypothetical protein
MSSLCTPLTLHHLRLESSGYPFGVEVSLDNFYVATTTFVNNAANFAYYDADTAKVADANYDNHDDANSTFDNDNNNNAADNDGAAGDNHYAAGGAADNDNAAEC